MLVLKLLAEVIKHLKEPGVPCIGLGAVSAVEHLLQLRIVELEQLLHRQSIIAYERKLYIYSLFVHAQLVRNLAVGHLLLQLEQNGLLETCH